jgi:hypothetical protein
MQRELWEVKPLQFPLGSLCAFLRSVNRSRMDTHTHTHMHTSTHTHMHTHTDIHARTHARIHTHTHLHSHNALSVHGQHSHTLNKSIHITSTHACNFAHRHRYTSTYAGRGDDIHKSYSSCSLAHIYYSSFCDLTLARSFHRHEQRNFIIIF